VVRVVVSVVMPVVVVVGVPVVVGFAVWCFDVDLEVDCADAVALDAFGGDAVGPIDRELGQSLLHVGELHAQVEQGAEEHVAGDAAEGVQVQVSGHGGR
jgi:hypothetical protein